MQIHPTSLYKTVNSVNETFFFGHKSTKAEREEIATWIVNRPGKPACSASTPGRTTNGLPKAWSRPSATCCASAQSEGEALSVSPCNSSSKHPPEY